MPVTGDMASSPPLEYLPPMHDILRDVPDLPALATLLDARSGPELRADIETRARADILRIWALAEHAAPLGLEHFVPAGRVAEPVHHAGWNSIPLFARWRRFEKRFARMADGVQTLVGYNEGVARSWMGPGYFVFRQSETDPHKARGAVYVDYLTVPDGKVPEGWPTVVENEKGLQRFVYSGTQDFMRAVSDRLSVGMPYKGETELPFPFVLVRL